MTAQTTNLIDITRHVSVFSPDKFGKRRVDVIGADAVGSHVVLGLAMLGIDGIHVWDSGKVTEKDIQKGAYIKSDMGKPRGDALKELVKRKTGCEILVSHTEQLSSSHKLGDIVFLLNDSIDKRKTVWQQSVRNKLRTKLLIEPRIGATELRVDVINPIKPAHVRGYEDALKSADMTGWSDMSCVTATFTAGLCVWQLMRWSAIEAGHEDSLDAELVVPLSFAGPEPSLSSFKNRRIDIIGAGATGSHVVLYLAKLGLSNIHVWDFDHVEAHNLANQAFMKDDIGKFKVDAVKKLVKTSTGRDAVTIHNESVDGSQQLGDIVFMLTDTMASRKQIWQAGIREKSATKLMVETRMGVDEGRVYTIEPSNPSHIKRWEDTLYDDAVAVASACGASVSVGPTAMFLASLSLWQMMRWAAQQDGKQDKLDNAIIFTLRPLAFVPFKFK